MRLPLPFAEKPVAPPVAVAVNVTPVSVAEKVFAQPRRVAHKPFCEQMIKLAGRKVQASSYGVVQGSNGTSSALRYKFS